MADGKMRRGLCRWESCTAVREALAGCVCCYSSLLALSRGIVVDRSSAASNQANIRAFLQSCRLAKPQTSRSIMGSRKHEVERRQEDASSSLARTTPTGGGNAEKPTAVLADILILIPTGCVTHLVPHPRDVAAGEPVYRNQGVRGSLEVTVPIRLERSRGRKGVGDAKQASGDEEHPRAWRH